MSFLKSLVFPNGMELSYHKIMKIDGAGDLSSLTLTISSWKNEEQYLTSVNPLYNSYEIVPLTPEILSGVTSVLYLNGTFKDAVITTDQMDSIETTRKRGWIRIKSERDKREYSPIAFAATTFDTDPESVRRIIGANVLMVQRQLAWVSQSLTALATAAGVTLPPLPVEGMQWTDATNTAVDLTLSQVQALGVAVATKIGVTHHIARGLRSSIESAPTSQAVALVQWPTT